MHKPTTNRKDNPWIRTAAYEIDEIRKRWRLVSNRQFAEALGIDRRTIAKLNPAHPDGSLTLETVDRIYSTLTALCCLYFGPEEMDDEYRRLADSRMRIARSVAPLPAAVRKRLEEEQGQKEKGDVPLRPVHPLK